MPMSVRPRALAALGLLALASAGCTSIRDHQGYVADEALIGAVQPGIDNRESVQGTLGRPTFVGQFDQRDWYYVSRQTKQLAFARPQPTQQTVLHVRFNEAGTVESVERTGLELARVVDPMGGRTPTLGSVPSFLYELIGNIGAGGGRGQVGLTAVNPQ